MGNDKQPMYMIVLTAAVTALVTTVMGGWVPNAAVKLYDRIMQEPVLIVEVTDNKRPIKNVKFTVSDGTSSARLASGETDENGSVRLRDVTTGMLVLEAVLDEGPYILKCRKHLKVESLPLTIPVDKGQDCYVELARAANDLGGGAAQPMPSPTSTQAPSLTPQAEQGLRYGKEPLPSDRRVQARLEIDWVDGAEPPPMKINTSHGAVTVEELFRDVGIDLEVVASDKLPVSVLGSDGAFSVEELAGVRKDHQNMSQPEKWNFYLVVTPRATTQAGSFMFDPEGRRGAAIVTEYGKELALYDQRYSDPRLLTFEVIHEMGHMLNLPHPWQAYGDTKSVMSYPFRWSDWSWDDPQVYRFDDFGRRHIGRAPDEYVKPGGSAFLDYGAPLPWRAAGGTR